jgi:hypothetical protein
VQNLHGRTTAEHRVLGQPHRAHAAFADPLKQAVRSDLGTLDHADLVVSDETLWVNDNLVYR